nr:reverse transcriptase domain-containing protein [Tanacetum cinerariifolium]
MNTLRHLKGTSLCATLCTPDIEKTVPYTIVELKQADKHGDIVLIENLLNEDLSLNIRPMKNEDLKQANVTVTKPSTEEPPELKPKDLPSHLEYAFLEGTDKLPIIISKKLKDEEKAALLKDDFKPTVQHQRRVNPKIHEVIKKKVIKLFDAELIYPISDSPWDLPFEIMCDASDYAVGAVLGQQKSKHFQPIHYASKTLTDTQAHYTTTEKELLVVVYAFEKFHPYLVLSKMILYTDHSALKYLLAKQDANPRLLRGVFYSKN